MMLRSRATEERTDQMRIEKGTGRRRTPPTDKLLFFPQLTNYFLLTHLIIAYCLLDTIILSRTCPKTKKIMQTYKIDQK